MNILFLASEVESFVKTGGLADVAKALPLALKRRGHDVRIVMPFYSQIPGRDAATHVTGLTLTTRQGHTDIPYQVWEMTLDDVPVMLVDFPNYFERNNLYAENNNSYSDNGERFAFFSAASLQVSEAIDFKPDIVHCNDWHTALVPMLLKTRYAESDFFSHTRSVLTIHNGAFQGVVERNQLWAVPEITDTYNESVLQGHAYINFLKCGVAYADKINAVSPSYANELTTYLGGHGMAKNFQERHGDLRGIINGCDYADWDPATDPHIPVNFTADSLSGKEQCKHVLQKQAGLPVCSRPLFGMVCRLTEQKGLHLLLPILDRFLVHQVQVVIVGTGDPSLAERLAEVAERVPERFAYLNAHDNALAHLLEAGSDFFLMPSLFEPCGLNQMYSLAYGTLPIVRAVGGLRDTVKDYDLYPAQATGFAFMEPEPMALLASLRRALLFYLQERDEMLLVQQRAMHTRYHWSESVVKYEQMYQDALGIGAKIIPEEQLTVP